MEYALKYNKQQEIQLRQSRCHSYDNRIEDHNPMPSHIIEESNQKRNEQNRITWLANPQKSTEITTLPHNSAMT